MMDLKASRSAQGLAYVQSRLAQLNPLDLWPPSHYSTLYSATRWPTLTVHHLRDPDHIKGVLVDRAHSFAKTPLNQFLLKSLLGGGLLTAEGDDWQRQRKSIAPGLKRNKIDPLRLVIEKTTRELLLLSAVDDTASTDILGLMSQITFKAIGELLFGTQGPVMPTEETLLAFSECLESVSHVQTPQFQDKVRRLRELAEIALSERRSQPADCLVDLFDPAGIAGHLTNTPDEVRDNILTFILAGHETTAVAATWTLYLLARNPSQQDQLHRALMESCGALAPLTSEILDHTPLLYRVICESLRLYPPVASIARVALDSVDIGGVSYASGDIADILIYPMHRNSMLWENPESFDPERFADTHARERHRFAFLPFGAGPRACIGSHMAYVEIAVIVATCLRICRFELSDDPPPKPHARISLRPQEPLRLFLRRR